VQVKSVWMCGHFLDPQGYCPCKLCRYVLYILLVYVRLSLATTFHVRAHANHPDIGTLAYFWTDFFHIWLEHTMGHHKLYTALRTFYAHAPSECANHDHSCMFAFTHLWTDSLILSKHFIRIYLEHAFILTLCRYNMEFI
jgi:hypothetical protein